jgi:hypothetical protein
MDGDGRRAPDGAPWVRRVVGRNNFPSGRGEWKDAVADDVGGIGQGLTTVALSGEDVGTDYTDEEGDVTDWIG